MIVMNIKIDNFMAFNDFHLSMSYPKRIVRSSIKEEHLHGYLNFRYKKIVILMGANAAGKTSLGQFMNNVFNFIIRLNSNSITSSICRKDKQAVFSIDFIPSDLISGEIAYLHRLEAIFSPDNTHDEPDIKVSHKKVRILKKDNYETASKRLDDIKNSFDDYVNVLRSVPKFGFFFSYPNDVVPNVMPKGESENYRLILEKILRSLDTSIVRVERLTEVPNSYSIHMLNGRNVLIQDGHIVDTALLSSGTKAGIAIADILTAIREHRCGFYYCDERFSFIQSHIERAVLAIMSELLGYNEQLFFTTHNMGVLNANFPKHTYVFMKKEILNDAPYITCVSADKFLKRNTASLIHAAENDLFSAAPDVDGLFEILNS